MNNLIEEKKCDVCSRAHFYFLDCLPGESITNDISKRFSLIHHDSKIQGEDKMFVFARNIGQDYPKQIWQPVLNGIMSVIDNE